MTKRQVFLLGWEHLVADSLSTKSFPQGQPIPQVINVANPDDRFFEWATLSAMYSVGFKDHASRVSKYQDNIVELNLTGIAFPVQVTSLQKFEILNPSISANAFYWDMGIRGLSPRISYITSNPEDRIKTEYALLTDSQDLEKKH